jgi:oligoendopeptidase F
MWIDVYETPNKYSGGYSMGIYGVHPYILLNYTDDIESQSTLIHELGHTMHSYLSSNKQDLFNAQYTIMVAEVASTVNEILLAEYLIKKQTDKVKKAYLINSQIDRVRATLVRQTMFAEFEKIIHEKVENDVSLSAEEISDIYYKLNKKYFGDNVISDDLIRYEWARIPHFYNSFYVYKYATGISSAIMIARKILNKEEGYVQKYLDMLSLGGSKDSLELLKMVDVDLETKTPVENAFEYYEEKINELEMLLK